MGDSRRSFAARRLSTAVRRAARSAISTISPAKTYRAPSASSS